MSSFVRLESTTVGIRGMMIQCESDRRRAMAQRVDATER